MSVAHRTLRIETDAAAGVYDITPALHDLVAGAGYRDGWVTVTAQHTTAAVTVNENEPRLLEDLKRFLAKLVPEDAEYLHNDIEARGMPDEPRNAHAHIAAMLLGATATLGVRDGRLALGQYQSVLFVELDGPRARRVSVTIGGVAPGPVAV